MATAFLDIANAIKAELLVATALAGGRIYKNRLRPLAVGHDSAVVVRLEGSVAQEDVLGKNDWVTTFIIECYGRGTTGNDPAEAADTLLAAVWARLAALSVSAYEAQSLTLNPEIRWEYEDAETPLVAASFKLEVQHRTPYATLTL